MLLVLLIMLAIGLLLGQRTSILARNRCSSLRCRCCYCCYCSPLKLEQRWGHCCCCCCCCCCCSHLQPEALEQQVSPLALRPLLAPWLSLARQLLPAPAWPPLAQRLPLAPQPPALWPPLAQRLPLAPQPLALWPPALRPQALQPPQAPQPPQWHQQRPPFSPQRHPPRPPFSPQRHPFSLQRHPQRHPFSLQRHPQRPPSPPQ